MTIREFGEAVDALEPYVQARIAGGFQKFDAENVKATFYPLMFQKVGVAFGGMDGILFGLITPDFFSGELRALEIGWFVKPCRGCSKLALLLLKSFEHHAFERGCSAVISGSSTSFGREGSMRRFYRRLGYVPHGEAFRKEL